MQFISMCISAGTGATNLKYIRTSKKFDSCQISPTFSRPCIFQSVLKPDIDPLRACFFAGSQEKERFWWQQHDKFYIWVSKRSFFFMECLFKLYTYLLWLVWYISYLQCGRGIVLRVRVSMSSKLLLSVQLTLFCFHTESFFELRRKNYPLNRELKQVTFNMYAAVFFNYNIHFS
jgi:hypothetical protein